MCLKCENCVFWLEAEGSLKCAGMGGCTYGNNNYFPMFLEEDCGLTGIHKTVALLLSSKSMKSEIVRHTSCLKIYHKREADGSMLFDLAIADKHYVLSDIIKSFAQKYDIPEFQVIVTYLYGEDDYEEIEICEPLYRILNKPVVVAM